MEKINKIIYAALLHDIGKLYQRADSVKEKHSNYGVYKIKECLKKCNKVLDKEILTAIENHHEVSLKKEILNQDNISYIVCEADTIASASERRDVDLENANTNFKKDVALESIFNVVYFKQGKKYGYDLMAEENVEEINMPKASPNVSKERYQKLATDFDNNLFNFDFEKDSPNSLLQILKNILNYVPSSTDINELVDISLYEHLKLTAGIAACMYYYCDENGITNYKERYITNKDRNAKEYIIASLDISGIQAFIYNIISKGAAKMLKARSFYIEIFLEHVIDEVLENLNLTRCNLIYSGGGHAYLLLPNTSKTKEVLKKAEIAINDWLIKKYKNSLYVAFAYEECCANNFNEKQEYEKLDNIFKNLSKKLTKKKLQRYNKEQLLQVLTPTSNNSGERECKVCKTSNNIIYNEKMDIDICIACENLLYLADKLTEYINQNKYEFIITISKNKSDKFIELPGIKEEKYMNLFKNEYEIEGEYTRIYTINQKVYGGNFSTNLNLGMYGDIKFSFEDYANKSIGIKKLGVLRADVDNLGKTFINGLISAENGARFATLSRYTILSTKLADFFKYNLNYICSHDCMAKNNKLKEICPTLDYGNVKIIYSGGDDLFIIGAWNEIIELALSIDKKFKEYTFNKLTLSCGIGMFEHKYPISKIASLVERMEDLSKDYDSNKNGITLFDVNFKNTFSFENFRKNIIDSEIKFMTSYCSFNNSDDDNKVKISNSFLHQLLTLFEKNEKINKVKVAYVLGRMEENIPQNNLDMMSNFKKLKEYIYEKVDVNESERNEFIMALKLIIYSLRG